MKKCLLFQLDGDDKITYIGCVDEDYPKPKDPNNGYFYFGKVLNHDVGDMELFEIQSFNHHVGNKFVWDNPNPKNSHRRGRGGRYFVQQD